MAFKKNSRISTKFSCRPLKRSLTGGIFVDLRQNHFQDEREPPKSLSNNEGSVANVVKHDEAAGHERG